MKSVIDEYTIQNWDEFDEIVKGMTNRQWIFRGQTNSKWLLESSLYRTFKYAKDITRLGKGTPKRIDRHHHELVALHRFINSANLFLDYCPPEDQPLEWLSVMQHYGAPTRLCDFTFSPYVAAYFALESGIADAAIFCIFTKYNINFLDSIDNFELSEDRNILFIYEPKHPSQRLLAQQGVFLVPGTLRKSEDQIIDTVARDGERFYSKYIIPANLRLEGLLRLRKYNINSSVLFPGLEGYCKTFNYQGLFSISDEIRIGDFLNGFPEGS